MKGTVFNIQKFSVNDGPGIRTTVFMKGCPLDCVWCHNPESKRKTKDIFYSSEKCVSCERCSKVCDRGCHRFENGIHLFDRENCIACGKCAMQCVNGALETVGYEITAEDVLKEVLKDKAFYESSGGGMTLSGGEPMYQFEFTYELLKLAKENSLHTCIETCGFAKAEQYCSIADFVDIFLYDYKETDPQLHKKFTGASNELILKNLKVLDEMGKKIILRCPIIPGLNDRDEHLEGIASMANSLKNILEINIEPYHPLGQSKAERLDKDYALKTRGFVDEIEVKKWIDYIAGKTNIPVKKA